MPQTLPRTQKAKWENFTSTEKKRLAGALRTAIEIYHNDSVKLAGVPGHQRMSTEFLEYETDCEDLLNSLESFGGY
jgi:hypothetical protein